MESKTCCRCGRTKSTDDFHRRAASSDGLNSACKECICAERRAYTAANPEKLASYRREYDAKNREAKLARLKEWRSRNVEHRSAYSKKYAEAHAEEIAQNKRAWYEANRDEVLERQRLDVEGTRAKSARYREANRDRRAEAQRRRRVDKLGLTVADVDLDSLWTELCGICDGAMDRSLRWPDPFSPSVDHIWPLALGGTHEAHNLQWAHLRCNVAKGARVSHAPEDLEAV